MMKFKFFALMIVLTSLVVSQVSSGIEQNSGLAGVIIILQGVLQLVSDILGVLLFTAILLAALVYAIGQSLNAEYRARANVYANNLLGGILIAAVLLLVSHLVRNLLTQQPGIFDWQSMALLIAFFSVAICAGAIVLSRIFDNKNIEQAAKIELAQAVSTALLVFALVGLLGFGENALKDASSKMFAMVFLQNQAVGEGFMDNALRDIKTGEKFTLIDVSQAYMLPVQGCITSAMKKLYYAAIPADALATVYMEIFMSEHATGFAYKLISERISNTASLLQFFLFIYYLLSHILNFLKVFAPAFLVIGILLRAFPPTRGGGAYMIALTLGLYFVFPFTYILGSTMYSVLGKEVFSNSSSASVAYFDAPGHVTSAPVCTFIDGQDIPPIFQTCGAGNASKVTQYLGWFDQFENGFEAFLSIVNGTLLKALYNTVCFLPAVALTLTLTFVLSTTGLFGGNIPEIGRGLVKLI